MDTGGINAIRVALDNLRDSHAGIEEAFKLFEEQDLTKENARLRETIEQLNIKLQENREETAELGHLHEQLTYNFKHELSSKRFAMLSLTARQQQAYLSAGLEREQSKINELYAQLHEIMDNTAAQLGALDVQESESLYAELNHLHSRVTEKARQAHARKEAAWSNAASSQACAINEMNNSPIEDAALGAVRQFFAWEAFWGLKVISAVGALLLLLGVFTFGRYLYTNIMGPGLQCALIFFLGIVFIEAGEIFYKKKWRGGFASALTASGSGILFLGAALGYMTLGVLPMWAAFCICAVVSLFTFAASLRDNAQLIAIFALIGGYLPIITLEEHIIFFSAVYFTVLSLLSLLIATRKNWRIARFIGLGGGVVSGLIMILLSQRWTMYVDVVVIIGVSIAINFMAYLIIPIFGAWLTKTRIKTADIVLLSCNVFFSFLLGLYWATAYEWVYHSTSSALVAAFFAVCCIAMALAAERQKYSGVPKSEMGSLRALFFITSITFSALIVLFAFDSAWFSAGWLVQAAGLSLYGIFKERRRFSIAGSVVGVFCLLSFLVFNVSYYTESLFVWQYLSITLTAAVVSAATLKCRPKQLSIKIWLDIFRSAAAFNLWCYLVYALYNPLMPAIAQRLSGGADIFACLLSITFGFTLAFLLPRIQRACNCSFQIVPIAIGVINTLWLLSFNAEAYGLASDYASMRIAVFALYILVNIVAVAWIGDLLRFLDGVRKLPVGWYPLLISGFAVLIAAQNLIVQMSLEVSSLILTMLFGLTALGWVVFGIVKRNGVTRISGLSMAFFAVIKLFVLDLHGLETRWRIASYFTAGAMMLAISFAYQWVNRRLEIKDKKPE